MGRRSRKNSKLRLTALFLSVSLILVGSVAFINYDFFRAQYLKYITQDFQGPGNGEVVVRIEPGDEGLIISKKLFEAGVIKDIDSFYRLLIEENPVFYPGSFMLRLEMSNQAALDVITKQSNAMTFKITIPEGFRAIQIFEEISKVTGAPVPEIVEVASDLKRLGLPKKAKTIEGYLFPATYSFDPKASTFDILQTMVERMKSELRKFEVQENKWHELLTLASIVQREAKLEADFYKVSRVFSNRLDIGMMLQTDPTISYSFDGTDMSKKTKQEQLEHGYNTYLVSGLPPGPISSPGSLAINATLNPTPGPWLYFVTIDLRTGETKFSETLAQHEEYVKLLREWENENPGWYDN
jgi:UPF0755 protein